MNYFAQPQLFDDPWAVSQSARKLWSSELKNPAVPSVLTRPIQQTLTRQPYLNPRTMGDRTPFLRVELSLLTESTDRLNVLA